MMVGRKIVYEFERSDQVDQENSEQHEAGAKGGDVGLVSCC